MGRPTALQVDLLKLKEPMLELCQRRGIKPSELVRRLVSEELAADEVGGAWAVLPNASQAALKQRLRVLEGAEEKPSKRLHIRLTNSEYEGLKVFAKADGYTPNRWVASLIRGALSGTPQFSSRETTLIMHSNSNLLAIGRNLNQAVKRLHVAPNEREQFRAERIAELSSEILRHVKSVSALVTANIKRWKLEPK